MLSHIPLQSFLVISWWLSSITGTPWADRFYLESAVSDISMSQITLDINIDHNLIFPRKQGSHVYMINYKIHHKIVMLGYSDNHLSGFCTLRCTILHLGVIFKVQPHGLYNPIIGDKVWLGLVCARKCANYFILKLH